MKEIAANDKADKLTFTLKMMEAMKKYAEQLSGVTTGDPVTYEGRKFDGFLNVVVLEDGVLASACNISTGDVCQIIHSLGDGVYERSEPGSKGRLLLGLLGAKFMAKSVEGLEGGNETSTKAIADLKKLLTAVNDEDDSESTEGEEK